VDSFSPASGNQFALLPADNATGNFTKIVQRVPVKITFKPEDLKKYCRPPGAGHVDRGRDRPAPEEPAAARPHRLGAVRTVMSSTKMTAQPGRPGMAAPGPRPTPRVDARTWIAVAAGMLGAFMAVLDIQITNSSLRDILGTLSATQEEGSWISTAYLCAEIVVIPMTALFVRALGQRRYLMITTALFLAFSTLCGTAWNLQSMIVFRMLQGFTGGALIPMAMTLVMTRLPPSKRAVGMAMFGLTATLAPAMGPTLGGYLTELYGWPSIFYINWVPGVLLMAGMYWGIDKEPMNLQTLFKADWLGIAFMALGLAA
jgi:DHA2 family multidrug resistance protein